MAVCIADQGKRRRNWGWGVVVNVVKKPTAGLGALPSKGGGYIVDILLHCSLDQVRVALGQDHAQLGLEKRVGCMWYVDASV